MSKKSTIPEGDPRHLDAIDDILGGLNLATTLESLAPLALFTDSVHGMPIPTDEDGSTGSAGTGGLADTWRMSVHAWHVAYFALVALKKANPYRRASLRRDQLVSLVNHYNLYDMQLSEECEYELIQPLVRMAYQQFPFQRAWWAGVSDARFMYEQSEECDGVCLPGLVQAVFGMHYSELLSICTQLYYDVYNMVRNERPVGFTIESLADGYLRWIGRDTLDRVFKAMSQTQKEFKDQYTQYRCSDRLLRKFDFNPLLARPLVRIGREYYSPVPELILMWATSGIAYILLQYATDLGQDGQFGNAFGKAFEDYIDGILRASGRGYSREPIVMTHRQRESAADFVVVEGDHALIFDCKAARTTLEHKYGILDGITRDYDDIVKGLGQTMCTEKWIRDGRLPIAEYPALANVTEFSHAVVTHRDYHLANSGPMRRWVWDRLGTELDYYVFSGRELELMLTNLPQGSLIPFIKGEISHDTAEDPEQDIHCLYEDYLRQWLHKQGTVKLVDSAADWAHDEVVRLRSLAFPGL